jgi:hypothetical protein
LSQLLWYAGNLVDDLGLPRTSFWADLTTVNDDDVVEAFVDDKVLVNIDATDATDMVGEDGNTFLWMLSKKQLQH